MVPAVILAAKDEDAFNTLVFVVETLVPIVDSVLPRLDDAAFILLLIAVWAAVIFPAVLAVPAVIADAKLVEALVTSDCTASEPDERPAPVRVLEPKLQICEAVRLELPVERARPMVPLFVSVEVATFQTSAASVPNVVSERVPADQTAAGMVDANEVEAVRTVASVWVLIVLIAVVN